MLAVPCACEVVRVCGYSSPIAKHGVKLNSQQFSLLALSISTIERKRKRDDFMKFNPFPIIDVSSYHSFLFDSYLLILFLLLLLLSITKSLSISLSLINFFPTQKLNNRVSMGEKVGKIISITFLLEKSYTFIHSSWILIVSIVGFLFMNYDHIIEFVDENRWLLWYSRLISSALAATRKSRKYSANSLVSLFYKFFHFFLHICIRTYSQIHKDGPS